MSLLGGALAALRGRRRDVPVEAPAAWEDDREMVAAIIDGSQAAFAQLVQAHQRTCAHVIGRMVGDRDQVADLLQETFLAVFRQLHRFRFESSLRTWVSRVAYTTALQHLRRRRLEMQWMVAVEVPEELGIGDEGPGPAELSEALQAGRLGGAALDVFAQEPQVPEALLGMDNVVLLPHIGSATRETRGAMEDLVLANLQRFLAEGQLVTPV